MAIETLPAIEINNFNPVVIERDVDVSRGFRLPANDSEVAIFALGDILSQQEDDLYDTVMPKLLPVTPEEASRQYTEEELTRVQEAIGQLVATNQLSITCIRPLKEQLGLPLQPETNDSTPTLF